MEAPLESGNTAARASSGRSGIATQAGTAQVPASFQQVDGARSERPKDNGRTGLEPKGDIGLRERAASRDEDRA